MQEILNKQRKYFLSGATRDANFRTEKLNKLKETILKKEKDLTEALQKDLHKSAMESYSTEIGIVLEEIKYAVKNLKSWSKPKRVKSPLITFLAKSLIYPEPYGVSLIIGTWNYPVQLSLGPLVGSIAGGNCSIVKLSQTSSNCSKIISDIIKETFDENYIAAVEGGRENTQALLDLKFDYIFFTGGTKFGKIVMEAASKNLTPLTLELGGKSPCIVDRETDIETTARRIAWGKFINTGQTCVAPDYLIAHKEIKDRLVDTIKKYIREFYSENPKNCFDYGRIVNEKHFNRLVNFLNNGKIIFGGKYDAKDLYISPTLLDNIDWNNPIMQEEIFGPILPILTFDNLDEIISKLNKLPKPLALYFFSNDYNLQEKIILNTSSGGVCINGTIYHQINSCLPFGGIGDSGMGAYHGKSSFDTFTHYKSVMKKSFWPDLKIAYPPYKDKLKFVKKIWG